MTSYIRSFCCAIMLLLLGSDTSTNFTYEKELYDGSSCTTKHGKPGICKNIIDCPSTLADVRAGTRTGDAAERCGFDSDIEIVCCPENLPRMVTVENAFAACSKLRWEFISVARRKSRCRNCAGGGYAAIDGEFPFIAALGYVNGNDKKVDSIVYDCGGSLISPNYILTAAHCVSNNHDRVPEWVRLGSVDTLSLDAQVIPIGRTIPHPRYRRGQHYHDIAIVKLQRPAKLSRQTYPVCLQMETLPYPISNSTTFVTVGFGALSPTDTFKSNKLMKSADLNLVPVTLCNESYTNFAPIPHGIDNTMICAVDENSVRASDACEGDSGGPLLMINRKHFRTDSPILIAVTSFGQLCRTVVPSVYTSVFAYSDWIESVVWPEETELEGNSSPSAVWTHPFAIPSLPFDSPFN